MKLTFRPLTSPVDLPIALGARIGAAGAALLLSACANFGGIHSDARMAPADQYASTESLPGQGGDWPRQSWAGDLGGPELQALVDEALQGNPNLQAAAARVANARALARAAAAAKLPTVGASASSTYQRYTENGLIPPPLAGSYQSDNELALGLSWDLDFWDQHGAQLRAALALGKATAAEEADARLMLSTAIARTWLQLGRQSAQLQLTERQFQLRARLDQLTRQRIAAGLDSGGERHQTELQLATLRADRAQWQEAMALTRNQLAALLGQGPDRGQRIAAPQLPPLGPTALPDQLPLMLLGRRPDIVASRWRVEAAQGDIDVTKAQFYPNINLSAFIGLSSLGLSNLLNSGSTVAGVGPALRLPVFEGGALRAQLQARVASYDAAVALYNQTLTEALHQVADQVQSLRGADHQRRERQQAVAAAEASLKLARQRQQVGTGNMLQVLASESAWLAQRQLELETQARQADLQVGLIKALGGGFDATQADLATAAASQPPAAQQ